MYMYVHKNTYVAQVNISVIELIGQLKCVVLFFLRLNFRSLSNAWNKENFFESKKEVEKSAITLF